MHAQPLAGDPTADPHIAETWPGFMFLAFLILIVLAFIAWRASLSRVVGGGTLYALAAVLAVLALIALAICAFWAVLAWMFVLLVVMIIVVLVISIFTLVRRRRA